MTGAPILSIRLDDEVGAMIFKPLHDLETYELALILVLFQRLSLNPVAGPMAWRDYLHQHSLLRHFTVIA